MGYYASGFGLQYMAPLSANSDVDPSDTVFSTGQNSCILQRIPLEEWAPNGDLLHFTEYHTASQDFASKGIFMARSTDGGKTFGQKKLIFYRSDYSSGNAWVNAGTIIKNRNGRLFLMLAFSDGVQATASQIMTLKYIYSDDSGVTWLPSQTSATDITTGLKKINNAGLSAALQLVYDSADAPWQWCMFGPGRGYCDPVTGQLIVTMNHRYTKDQTGTSWCHCIISNDDGATWVLGGGLKESTAQNACTNECTLVRMSGGNYYLTARVVSGGSFTSATRAQSIITTAQLTGVWPTATAMIDGNGSNIEVNSCAGMAIVDSYGDLMVTLTTNNSSRSNLSVFRSQDQGLHFTKARTLYFPYCGYSTLLESQTTPGNYLVSFEATDDWENSGQTDSLSSQQLIRFTRFDKDWFENEATQPSISTYYLNEGQPGIPTYTGGTEIGSYEGFTNPGKGGAGLIWDIDGLRSVGSGAGIEVGAAQPGNNGGRWDAGLKPIVMQFIMTWKTPGGTVYLFDNRNNAGRGCSITMSSSMLLSVTMHDGTTPCTATQSVPWTEPGGVPSLHNYTVTYARGVGIKVYIDGTLVASAADNLSATQGIVGSAIARIGSLTGGGSPLPADCVIRMFRVSNEIKTSGFMPSNTIRPSIGTLSGYNYNPVANLPSTAGMKLAMFAPFMGGVGAYGSQDRYSGITHPYRPPINGSCCESYVDKALRTKFAINSLFKGPYWDFDSDFGAQMIRLSNNSSDINVSQFKAPAVSDFLDFIQNTMKFTIMLCPNIIADTFSVPMVMLDNITATSGSTGGGFCVLINSGVNQFHLVVSIGTTVGGVSPPPRYSEAIAGTITYNKPYFVCWVGNGASAKVHTYKAQYTLGTLGTLTKVDSTASATAGGSLYPSDKVFTIGSKEDGSRGPNGKLGPILIFDRSMTPAEVAQWAPLMNTLPVNALASLAGANGGCMFNPEGYILGK